MGRVLSIDYGAKRSGIAVTDPLKIIASPLKGIATSELMNFLMDYCKQEDVEQIVVGKPIDIHGRKLAIADDIVKFAAQLEKQFPKISICFQEESYSSKEAAQLMIESNRKKKYRMQKENLDMFSALIILRRYLGYE